MNIWEPQFVTAMLAFGTATGVVAHLSLFIHGEWHIHAPVLLVVHVFMSLLPLILNTIYKKYDSKTVLQATALFGLSYYTALFTSIAVYRLFFHRLARAGFPGPVWARLTKIWHVWGVRGSQNHLFLADLHRKYGDFIRTG